MRDYTVFDNLVTAFLHKAFLLYKEAGDIEPRRVYKLRTLNRTFSSMLMYTSITKYELELEQHGYTVDDSAVLQDTFTVLYNAVIDELYYIEGKELKPRNLAYCLLKAIEPEFVPFKLGWLSVVGRILAGELEDCNLVTPHGHRHPIYTELSNIGVESVPGELDALVNEVSTLVDKDIYDLLLSVVTDIDNLLTDYQ